LSVAVSGEVPLALPLATGLNTTMNEPVPPAAIEVGEPAAREKSAALAPVKLAELIASALLELLVIDAVLLADAVVDELWPRMVSGIWSAPKPSASALPVSRTDAMASPSLLGMERLALRAEGEVDVGAKVMANEVEAPAARVFGSALAAGEMLKSALVAPESVGWVGPLLEKFSVSVPMLVMVASCGSEATPMPCVPKERLDGWIEREGKTPLPTSETKGTETATEDAPVEAATKLSVALAAALVAGKKVTETLIDEPGFTVLPAAPETVKAATSGPVMVVEVIAKPTLPLFETAIVWAALVVSLRTLPKLISAGDAPAVASRPVPLKLIGATAAALSLAKVSVADSGPAGVFVGAKRTVTLVFPPAPTAIGSTLVTLKSLAFKPLKLALLTLSGEVPELTTRKLAVADAPTLTAPKLPGVTAPTGIKLWPLSAVWNAPLSVTTLKMAASAALASVCALGVKTMIQLADWPVLSVAEAGPTREKSFAPALIPDVIDAEVTVRVALPVLLSVSVLFALATMLDEAPKTVDGSVSDAGESVGAELIPLPVKPTGPAEAFDPLSECRGERQCSTGLQCRGC